MPIISFRRRTGLTIYALFLKPSTGQCWRVTGGAGDWATWNSSTSLPAEFTFVCAESPAGSGRYHLASPPTSFTDPAKVPAGSDVTVWLICPPGAITNADIAAGGPSFARQWNATTQELDDPGEFPSDYPATWPRPATSATFELHLAGATSASACGCKSSRCCGSARGGESTLYKGDTRERVFFLLDAGKSVVALPAGVYIEIWDEDAKVADATVSVTDPARWVGTVSIDAAEWASVPAGGFWLRVLDGDDQVVTIQPLTVLDPGQV